jgi:hypothetical protein
MKAGDFQLQFTPAKISQLTARYVYADNSEALKAGKRIAEGDYRRANLDVIFRWKREAGGYLVCAGIQTRRFLMRFGSR